MEQYELLRDVLLLALSKKESSETIEDILKMLESSGAMSLQEGHEIILDLKEKGAIVGDGLSFVGLALAKEAQQKFTL